MSFLSQLKIDTPGLAIYSIPVAFFVGLAPHVNKLMLLESSGIKVDNRSPRLATDQAEKKGVPSPVLSKIHRLGAAHQNAIENFPVFAAAVLAAVGAGLPAGKVNVFAGGYVALRVLYNYAYANQTTQALAAVRSISFWAGTGWAIYILISAGNWMVSKSTF